MYESNIGQNNVHKYTDYEPVAKDMSEKKNEKPTAYAWFVLFMMFMMRVVH